MTIGKPIRQRADWDTDVEFPLLLTWYNRLRSHHFQTRVEDAKRHLDIMEVDAVSIKLGHNWVLVICLESLISDLGLIKLLLYSTLFIVVLLFPIF